MSPASPPPSARGCFEVNVPTQIAPWSIVVAFLVAVATGLIFGLYPAMQAAKKDPIVALRHD